MKQQFMTLLQLERATTNKWVRMAVLPTEDCIYDCHYCPQDHRIYREREFPPMSTQIVSGTQKWVKGMSENGLQKASLSWFGGEPLMAPSQIEDISLSGMDLGINVEGDMVTNGALLNRRMLDRMQASGVRAYKISFDGPREHHDATRILKLSKKQMLMKDPKRKGQFDKLWGNLLEAKHSEHQFTITIRIHIHHGNIGASMDNFVHDVYETFIRNDSRFRCEFEDIHDMGGVAPKFKKLIMKKEDNPGHHIARFKELVGDMRLVQHQEEGAPAYWCYASKLNNWVLRRDGRIGKCTVHLDATFAQLLANGTADITNLELLNMFYEGYADGQIKNFNLWALACPANWLKNKYGREKMVEFGFNPVRD